MKATVVTCDVCGNYQPEAADRHWSDAFGRVEALFKQIPSIQMDIVLDDVCRSCAGHLYAAFRTKLEEIKK